jgi:hypothetical protein
MVLQINLKHEADMASTKFDFIQDESSRWLLTNGYTAISQLELWDWLKTFEPGECGFAFSDDPNISIIAKKMHELSGDAHHSGTSFGWTMRNLEFIAKHGMDKFKELW